MFEDRPNYIRGILIVLITILVSVAGTIFYLDEVGLLEPTIEVERITEVVSDERLEAFVDNYLDSIDPDDLLIESVVVTDLEVLNESLTNVVEDVTESVIGVANVNTIDEVISTGSGVIYKYEDGYYYAITNHHVIEDYVVIRAYFSESEYVVAEIVGYDEETDLAVIKFQVGLDITPVEFADPKDIQPGQLVVAIGSPSGFYYFNSATLGMISGVDRYVGTGDLNDEGYFDFVNKMVQHDTAINPGNSGGPLFDISGKVVGINTLKFVDDTIEGMGFSIPVDVVQRVAVDIEEYGHVVRTVMGVLVGDVRYLDDIEVDVSFGCYVHEVVEAGPAAETSDLQVGDVITSYNGVDVAGLYELKDFLFFSYPGDEIVLGINRNGEQIETTITLGEKPID